MSFVHTVGIVIGGTARVGSRVRFMGSNTVGTAKDNGYPVIEDDVEVGAGARILGPIRVGARSVDRRERRGAPGRSSRLGGRRDPAAHSTEGMTAEERDPRVSLVLATYNRGRASPSACSTPWREQTSAQDAFEVIVVDDGSSPPAREVLVGFAPPFRFRLARAGQRRRGRRPPPGRAARRAGTYSSSPTTT